MNTTLDKTSIWQDLGKPSLEFCTTENYIITSKFWQLVTVSAMHLVICTSSFTLGRSSLTNEKDHHYFLNRFVCVGEFFDG